MKLAIACYFVLGMMTAFGLQAETSTWTSIEPVHEAHTFIDPGKNGMDTPFLLTINATGGGAAYKLECHNGNYDDESEINFSGDFQCALFAVKGNTQTSSNLLATASKDEQSTDWFNRGRMRSAQLRGECLRYPEYSTLRHFKVRGILITLRFTEIEWSGRNDQQGNPMLGKLTFALDVVPEKTASSSTAEPAAGPKPPSFCYP